MSEPAEIDYFQREVEPYLSDVIQYVGEASNSRKLELFSATTSRCSKSSSGAGGPSVEPAVAGETVGGTRGDARLVTAGRRLGMGTVLAVAGVLGVLVASFLPWARSGNASRTSYELVATASRLDVISGTGATLVRGWYLLPVAAAGTWLAATLGRPLVTATLSILVGSAALGLVAVLRASGSSLAVAHGTSVALAAGATALIGAARLMWEHRRRHDGSDARPSPGNPSTREW